MRTRLFIRPQCPWRPSFQEKLRVSNRKTRVAGYWTLGVVSNKLLFRPYGYDQGFDEWVEIGSSSDEKQLSARQASRFRTADKVNGAVFRAVKKRPKDKFFLYVHDIDVHDWILFDISYKEAVKQFDRHLGRLLSFLSEQHLLEDSLLVFTSDHGEMLVDEHLGLATNRHYGNPSFEPLLRVPLIISPAPSEDEENYLRSQDIKGLIARLAGLGGEPASDLEAGELLVTEATFQTYRKDN